MLRSEISGTVPKGANRSRARCVGDSTEDWRKIMRRNSVFGRDRSFHPEGDRKGPLHLRPRHGAAIGQYSSPEPNEYSDDYYGPADDYEARGFEDDVNPPRQSVRGSRAGVVLRDPNIRPTARPTDSGHYGQMNSGSQSWGSLKRHMEAREPGARQPKQNFRGRGPKGYVRSDARLHEVICEMLTHDPHIDASEVSIEVKDGEVTLTGNVDDRRTKYAIEEKIDACHGVKEIHNRVRSWRPR
jgi:osmotically-inducible protein OsmY